MDEIIGQSITIQKCVAVKMSGEQVCQAVAYLVTKCLGPFEPRRNLCNLKSSPYVLQGTEISKTLCTKM